MTAAGSPRSSDQTDTLQLPPRVHAAWTADWFAGRGPWGELFGPAPAESSLRKVAAALTESRQAAQRTAADSRERQAAVADESGLPRDALLVLAGQQPGLGGGAALVVHKAATAIRLAQDLTRLLARPVVPVFLLASEDHDTREVDHLDLIEASKASVVRVRCPIQPERDSLSKGSFDESSLKDFSTAVESSSRFWSGTTPPTRFQAGDAGPRSAGELLELAAGEPSVARHARVLLERIFAGTGLVCVSAEQLTARAGELLQRAAGAESGWARCLADGAAKLRAAGLAVPFDPADPRPLLMLSSAGRRQRAGPPTAEASAPAALRAHLAREPGAFSPHAALRPLVQAATLPVIAQIVGPSELIYLGQARSLHQIFGLTAPVLVPRLELTTLPAGDRWSLRDVQMKAEVEGLLDSTQAHSEAQSDVAELISAGQRFARRVARTDPALAPRAERWLAGLKRSTARLAEAPVWRGRGPSRTPAVVLPRNRPQDSVLGWLPMALACASPEAFGRELVRLAAPLAAPRHLVRQLASRERTPVR